MIRDDSPPDSAYGLWFYPAINRFMDEDGNILHDLHELFNTCEVDMWKRTEEYGFLISKQGDLVELYFVEPEIEEHVLSHAFLWDEDKENYERYLNALYKEP